ncbi:hypothetical protein INT44_005293 [Umbelopsis vinacea]|uniref:GRIP domain-containing protein n=1 Tax=Umbelopsis vinacea TaxID=44442 RepID=A0A8H7Q6X7_9FUNG|nr:hypothetical protein INT44_005293 [Umbelopsis vinacea]
MEADQGAQVEDRTTFLEEQLRTLQTENSALKSKSRELERKLEETNGRPLTPKLGNSESLKNFREDGQIQELKSQLKSKQDELNKVQVSLKTRTNDYEEKLKRMRGIFAQASKSLDEYRATIAKQTEQISSLEETAAASQQKLEQVEMELNIKRETLDTLESESKMRDGQYGSKISELEIKLRQSTSQLSHTTTEYQQYKQRANTLLQQMSPDDNEDTSRTTMLESELNQLKLERTELVNVSSTSAKRIKVLEQDLRQTLETVEQLQKEKKNAGKLEKQCDQLRRELLELRKAKIDEKARFEKELENLQAQYVNLQARKSEPNHIPKHANDIHREKEEENEQLKATITTLNDEITCLKAEVKSLEDTVKEIQKAPVFESQDRIEENLSTTDQRSARPLSPNSTHTLSSPTTGSVYASLSNLLSPTQLFGSETSGGVSPAGEQVSSNNSSLMKEKEYQQQLKYLAEMLNDSENVVMTLRAQEKTLKEEISDGRKMDAFDRRQNLNIEYLKNVFFKYLKSENKQTMVPILSKLLSLDDKETQELQMQSNPSQAPKSGLWS